MMSHYHVGRHVEKNLNSRVNLMNNYPKKNVWDSKWVSHCSVGSTV